MELDDGDKVFRFITLRIGSIYAGGRRTELDGGRLHKV